MIYQQDKFKPGVEMALNFDALSKALSMAGGPTAIHNLTTMRATL